MNWRRTIGVTGGVVWLCSAVPVPAATLKVRVGHFPNVTHAQALVGHANGWFADALGPEIEIEWKIFHAGPAAVHALFAESIDLAYLGSGPAIVGYVKSRSEAVRIIAGASDGGAALIVRPGAGIRTPADFHGKRVASPQLGNTQDVALRGWLAEHGLTPMERGGTVRVMPMANPDQLTMFRRGEIDAAWSPEPWASRLVHQGGGVVFLDEREHWKQLTGGKFATTLLVAHPRFLAAHPEVAARFVRAHAELTQWITHHTEQAKAVVNAELERETGKPLPQAVLDDSWGRMAVTIDPLPVSLHQMARWAFDQGFLGRSFPDLSHIVDSRWVDGLAAVPAKESP